jgi:hypothetical protein
MECPKSTGKTSAFGKSAVLFPFAKTAFASALLVLAMAASPARTEDRIELGQLATGSPSVFHDVV